ncbi:MAG TPA: aminotransferase class V-fold PLP-dependent enzyme [Gaiellaceae bacterium]|nr:aminotransferase class V-fold PLP-dependent enzyme [Gaiellaceae bacterium]
MSSLSIAEARALWEPAGTYLNTASYGLPPRPAWDALQEALEDWRGGRTSWEHWGAPGEEARASFARIVGVPAETVAIGPNVSNMIGLVAASISDGSRILAPDVEFTSLLFPFLVQESRGVTVHLVPPKEVAGEIGRDVDVVAFSAVQMATGEVADLDAIAEAAAEHEVTTVVDATQAVGWLPFDARRFDVVAAHGYKWLLSPRGTAYMTIRRQLLEGVLPLTAGWYAGEDPLATFFGPPLRLATNARRLDTSPAWFMWVASAPALGTLERIGVDVIHAHDVALANRFRAGLGSEAGDSAIVMSDAPGAAEKLERAGIRAAVRGGRLRTSWHVARRAHSLNVRQITLGRK